MTETNVSKVLAALDQLRRGGDRLVLAVAGAPGSGKSTFAQALRDTLEARAAGSAEVFPMDGYHLDNAILDAHGWRARKGAAHTFDVEAFGQDLRRIRARAATVRVPVFDRSLDLARAFAREITPACGVVIVEGNYLLLGQDPWQGLADCYDLSVFLSVPEPVLETRLIQRWLDHGLPEAQARARALGNDIPNARMTVAASRRADLTLMSV